VSNGQNPYFGAEEAKRDAVARRRRREIDVYSDGTMFEGDHNGSGETLITNAGKSDIERETGARSEHGDWGCGQSRTRKVR
jgi:hypothetical protein